MTTSYALIFLLTLVGLLFGPLNLSNAAEGNSQTTETAIFAGGCFWCMEKPFEKEEGVLSAVSGYTGGASTNPTYENYIAGGHLEAIQITYNPTKISYNRLLDIFWRQIDPTDGGGQFVDRGSGYLSAIFYLNEEQKTLAEQSKNDLNERKIFDRPLVTKIIPAQAFYAAEEYHQDYYKKNPIRYTYYRNGSGRDQFLKKVWGETPSKKRWSTAELKARLTPLQYAVTQEDSTEPAFNNEFWDNKKDGIYVDVVSGEPLFSSTDKFKSGTGWPSFSRPLVAENIAEVKDRSWFMTRVEVRSTGGDSHLGHVFEDGPKPTGLRYCINSAALRFIPANDLEKEGYAQFQRLFAIE